MGYTMSCQLEGEAAAEWQHLTGSRSRNFYLTQKTIGSHCGESEKRGDNVRIRLNKLKNGHLMGHHAVAF